MGKQGPDHRQSHIQRDRSKWMHRQTDGTDVPSPTHTNTNCRNDRMADHVMSSNCLCFYTLLVRSLAQFNHGALQIRAPLGSAWRRRNWQRSERKNRGKKRECRTSAGALPENMHRTEGSQALQVSAFRCTGLGQSFEMAPFRCSVRLLSNSAFEAKTKLRLLRSEKGGCLQDLHAQRSLTQAATPRWGSRAAAESVEAGAGLTLTERVHCYCDQGTACDPTDSHFQCTAPCKAINGVLSLRLEEPLLGSMIRGTVTNKTNKTRVPWPGGVGFESKRLVSTHPSKVEPFNDARQALNNYPKQS